MPVATPSARMASFCLAYVVCALAAMAVSWLALDAHWVISYLGAAMVVASGNNAAMGLTTGGLNAMFTYTTQILSSLMMLSMVFVMMIMSRAPMRRCAELLAEEPNLVSPQNPVKEVKDGSIDFENVSFRSIPKQARP